MTVKMSPASDAASPKEELPPPPDNNEIAARVQEIINHLQRQQFQNAPVTDVSIKALRDVVSDLRS